MGHAIYAFVLGIVVFALAGEADTPALRVVGTLVAIWLTFVGAASGWAAARK